MSGRLPVCENGKVGSPTAPRLDVDAVLRAMAEACGPVVVPVQRLPGGAVGAWKVDRPGGGSSVLTWRPPNHGRDIAAEVVRTSQLVAIARRSGVPALRYEDIVVLADGGVVVLQEFVAGARPGPSAGAVGSLLELSERRRGVLAGTPFSGTTPLYLTTDGPGFCLHGPLREHDDRTRRLLSWVEAVGRTRDVVEGDDLVHFDYHLGNALADHRAAAQVVAIVDWDGAGAGDVALDGVVLALDLVLYGAEAVLINQVVDHLRLTTPEHRLRPLWAHGLLRLVDWRIRHSLDDDLSWLPRAERVAGV